VLRSTFITRKLGGLLIAIVLAGLIIYPMVFSLQYLSLGNGYIANPVSSSTGAVATTFNYTTANAYGFNALTSIPGVNSAVNNGNYILNFYVEPNVKAIAQADNCWPGQTSIATKGLIAGLSLGTGIGLPTGATGLFSAEIYDLAYLLVPVAPILKLASLIGNAVGYGSASSFPLPYSCVPSDALNTFFALLNSYGIIGIDSYLLPIINIIVTLSSVVGLSQLFGGDTSLAGLSRLV
jgi:hypothetical protein